MISFQYRLPSQIFDNAIFNQPIDLNRQLKDLHLFSKEKVERKIILNFFNGQYFAPFTSSTPNGQSPLSKVK